MSMRVSRGATGRVVRYDEFGEVDWFTGRVELGKRAGKTLIPPSERAVGRHGVVRRYNVGKDGRVNAVKI